MGGAAMGKSHVLAVLVLAVLLDVSAVIMMSRAVLAMLDGEALCMTTVFVMLYVMVCTALHES